MKFIKFLLPNLRTSVARKDQKSRLKKTHVNDMLHFSESTGIGGRARKMRLALMTARLNNSRALYYRKLELFARRPRSTKQMASRGWSFLERSHRTTEPAKLDKLGEIVILAASGGFGTTC